MPYSVQAIQPKDGEKFVKFMESVSFSHAPHWSGCYCRFYHCEDAEIWKQRTAEQNRAEALGAIKDGSMRGYLAYDGDKIIGWCNANNLEAYHLLKPELSPIIKDQKTGVVICFLIHNEYQSQGVARMLLDAAILGFRNEGYDTVIAMPVDVDVPEKRYRGTLNMYQERGFIPEEHDDISLMRLALH
jgi:GNAT superfamily N-acetyltransferase